MSKKNTGLGEGKDGDMGRGQEGGDKGTSSHFARPTLSMSTGMCRTSVNTPMVRATAPQPFTTQTISYPKWWDITPN